MRYSLKGRHIRSLHASGRHPKIGPGKGDKKQLVLLEEREYLNPYSYEPFHGRGETDVSSYSRKEVDNSQQALLLSNSVQQRSDKCRGLLWPDAFKKEAYSPTVLNAAFR
ncbi:hypothetical protein TNCV_3009641 [Trichonephila clavipes]|nr:hypothetical protein TNCV_3009641 [Trichonephila clavipes]